MFSLLLKIVLGPALLLQGKYVRTKTEILPEPAGARSGLTGNGKPIRILVVGDSAAAGVGVEHQDEALLGCICRELADNYEVSYELIAMTGYTTSDLLDKLRTIDVGHFDVVVTSLGVNDVTSATSLSKFLREQSALINLLRHEYGAGQLILSGMPPMGHFPALPHPLRWYFGYESRRFDKALRSLASTHSCDFVAYEFNGDLSLWAADGFHPGPRVYQQWALMVAQKVMAGVNRV